MEAENIQKLVLKFNQGLADPVEIQQIEKLLEGKEIELTDLKPLTDLEEQLYTAETPTPPMSLDDRFYTMLAAEKRKLKPSVFSFRLPELNFLLPRLALAAGLLVCGFLAGYWRAKPGESDEMKALSQKVGDLKEMVMLSLLEKESASERLKAVSLTSDMDQASQKVTSALLQTLDSDNNVNVRLAALDALRPYVRDNQVRAELVRAIGYQDSPLVQVALAELMRDIQEKKSVKEFDKILKDNKMPQEVKNRIKEKIQILI